MVAPVVLKDQMSARVDLVSSISLQEEHHKIDETIKKTREYATARIKLGKKDRQERESILVETIRTDVRIEERGRALHQTLDEMIREMGVSAIGKIVSDMNSMRENLRKNTDADLTQLGYKKLTSNFDAFAADLSKVKFTLTGASVGIPIAIAGPEAAARLEKWSNNRFEEAYEKMAEINNEYDDAIDKSVKPSPKTEQSMTKVYRDFDRKNRQWKVIKGLQSLVKNPFRANLACAVITTIGIAADAYAATSTPEDERDDQKEPGSDLIA